MKRKNKATDNDNSDEEQPPVAKVARQLSDTEDEEVMDMSQQPDCPVESVCIFDGPPTCCTNIKQKVFWHDFICINVEPNY